MKYTTDQVIQGLMNYADAEVMNKLPISGKWIAGTAIGLASNRINHVVDMLRENAIANMLGIIDDDGMVDVDELVQAMRSSADKYGKLSVDIPLIGKLTFSSTDIDALNNYIR